MTEDYQDAVFAAYQKKIATDGRAFALYNPTGTRIRQECLNVYKSRHAPEDIDILAAYFDLDKLGTDFKQVLSKSIADDYRALYNHLTGRTGKTDEKNSDLLAWLIDFKSRPSFNYYNSLVRPIETAQGGDEVKTPAGQNEQDTDADIEKAKTTTSGNTPEKEGTVVDPEVGNGVGQGSGNSTPTDVKKPKSSNKNIFIAAAIVLIAISGFFQLWKDDLNASPIRPALNGQCMHWTGERYELIACDSKTGTTPIITADTFILAHQRKITRPDTLTRNALGNVWYAKIKVDSAEFYTNSGDYPLDTNKRLLPITNYMLNKYVFAKYAAKN